MKNILHFIILSMPIWGLSQNNITMRFSDHGKFVVADIQIVLMEQNRLFKTDSSGVCQIDQIPNGTFTFSITANGYASSVRIIRFPTVPEMDIELERSNLDIKEVTVIGNSVQLPDRNSRRTGWLTADQFRDKGFLTITEALSQMNGVSQLSTGPGVTRPVIRGLAGNRIMTLVNGVKLDNQQWDPEHALGLNQFGISRVEVIRGPLGFLYGAEAMGGVLHFVDEKPAQTGHLESDVHIGLNSSTFGTMAEAGVRKSVGSHYWILRLGVNNQSDYYAGFTERVANSRFREINAKGIWGMYSKRSATQLSYQLNAGFYGIVEPFEKDSASKEEEEDHPMEFEKPYHTMLHQTLAVKHEIFLGAIAWKIQADYQHDLRQEYEPSDVETNPFLGFSLHHLEGKSELKYSYSKGGTLTGGVQSRLASNSNFGYGILIPDYQQSELGLYLVNRNRIANDRLVIDAGIRNDLININTTGFGNIGTVDFMPSLNRNFSSLNGSLGLNLLLSRSWSFFINAGSGFRAPNAAELLSNGIRLETQRYEIGNAQFKQETNIQGETGINFENDQFELELTGYINQINGFILTEVSRTDSLSDQTGSKKYPVARFRQRNALITGAEAKWTWHPTNRSRFSYTGGITLTYGYFTDTAGGTLAMPMIPPYRTNHEVTLFTGKKGMFTESFLRAGFVYTFKQDRIYPATLELSTPDYLLINIHAGGKTIVYGQTFEVNAGIRNLTNARYLDHMSRLRVYDVRGMGFNVFVSINWNFTKPAK